MHPGPRFSPPQLGLIGSSDTRTRSEPRAAVKLRGGPQQPEPSRELGVVLLAWNHLGLARQEESEGVDGANSPTVCFRGHEFTVGGGPETHRTGPGAETARTLRLAFCRSRCMAPSRAAEPDITRETTLQREGGSVAVPALFRRQSPGRAPARPPLCSPRPSLRR